jgi:transcriptional regulator with XRE-family HTH domain
MPKTWTANQLVAYNLRRARTHRDLTQKEAAALLKPYLGTEWSVASFSAAESTAKNGARTRKFSADEILAFSRAFGHPVSYFFTPPEEETDRPVSCGGPKTVDFGELLDAVSEIDEGRVRMLVELLPRAKRSATAQAIRRIAYARLGVPAIRNVTEHAANLHRLANQLTEFDDKVQAELEAALGKED